MNTEDRNIILERYLLRLDEVMNEVWDAFETTYMSDAKTSVFTLREDVRVDQTLNPAIKQQLMTILDRSWSCMVGGVDTYERAQGAHGELSRAQAFLKSKIV